MKTDILSVAHAAFCCGADTRSKIIKATGLAPDAASNALYWIRKADGNLERARRLRSLYTAASSKKARHDGAAARRLLQSYMEQATRSSQLAEVIQQKGTTSDNPRNWVHQLIGSIFRKTG